MVQFTDEDRRMLQVLIDHHLAPMETIAAQLAMDSGENARRRINKFCERYQCIPCVQILDYPRLQLHPFFQITTDPLLDTRFRVRQFELFGSGTEYLSLCAVPEASQVPDASETVYPITKIYRPSNNIRLVYEEARTLGFTDEWLLNLKEVMVEQELGDIMVHQEGGEAAPIALDRDLLDQLGKIYLSDLPKLFDHRAKALLKTYGGLLSAYLEIALPGMTDYLLILDGVRNPAHFAGGFIGRFPLTELYEAPHALIARIQTPEPNYAKFNLSLYTHLIAVATPNLWLLVHDARSFTLQDQWEDGHWKID